MQLTIWQIKQLMLNSNILNNLIVSKENVSK